MPISRKNVTDDQPQSAPKHTVRRTLSVKNNSQLPSKRTINLCMREKSGISVEVFLAALAAILVVVMLVEFFGVYRPYLKVEELQNDLAAVQRDLDDKNKKMKDMDDYYLEKYEMHMEEYYNQFNFNGFDRSIADRLDILNLLDKIVGKEGFESAELRKLSVNGNTVDITVDGLDGKQVAELFVAFSDDPLVERAVVRDTGFSNNIPYATMIIYMADATKVQEDNVQ